jgi:hypothetical protein
MSAVGWRGSMCSFEGQAVIGNNIEWHILFILNVHNLQEAESYTFKLLPLSWDETCIRWLLSSIAFVTGSVFSMRNHITWEVWFNCRWNVVKLSRKILIVCWTYCMFYFNLFDGRWPYLYQECLHFHCRSQNEDVVLSGPVMFTFPLL